jgi:hypothetical protein
MDGRKTWLKELLGLLQIDIKETFSQIIRCKPQGKYILQQMCLSLLFFQR